MPASAIARMEPDAVDPLASGASDELTTLASIAISLKRIADACGTDSAFLVALGGTLEDASHNHQQRMRNL